jgi:hypothetical protein
MRKEEAEAKAKKDAEEKAEREANETWQEKNARLEEERKAELESMSVEQQAQVLYISTSYYILIIHYTHTLPLWAQMYAEEMAEEDAKVLYSLCTVHCTHYALYSLCTVLTMRRRMRRR